MKKVWFISDTHFGHKNIINFDSPCGTKKLRPFDSIEDHDELIVKNWNSVVGEFDRVYHMGDVVIAKSQLNILNRLNGKKKLIKGNHDIFSLKDYAPYFEDIISCKVYPEHNLIFTHIPIHESNLTRFKTNCHGHTHGNFVTRKEYVHYPEEFCHKPEDIQNENYMNLCVENTGYSPVSLDDIIKSISFRKENR